MSHSKHKLSGPPPHADTPPPLPRHRVGDLLWCRENKKRYSLWWPAMVTYDPHLAILARTTSRGIPQVHVQYFGISAVRGWVSQLQHEPLVDAASRKLPAANIGKKMRSEFEVAVREATEALRMTHKERKLKFIFNFDPPPAPLPEVGVHQVKAEQTVVMGDDMRVLPFKRDLNKEEDSSRRVPDVCGGGAGSVERKRSGKRRVNSANCPLSPTPRTRNQDLSLEASSRRHIQSCGSLGGGDHTDARDFVVSVAMNGLGVPSGPVPSLLVGESPTTMDSFAVSVNTVLNLASGNGDRCPEKPPNGMVAPLVARRRGRPRKNSTKQNFRHAPPLGEKEAGPPRKGVESELFPGPPPVKRLALDPGSESGSEASGVSMPSAILTPPSSGTEAAVEDEGGGGRAGAHSDEKQLGRRGARGRTKQGSAQEKTRTDCVVGSSFRDGDCAICDASDSGLLACQGHCLQAFHVDCLGLVQPPNFQFVCDECQAMSRQCFVCTGSSGRLECCSKPRCGKFYHRSCIHDDRLLVWDDLKSKFTCPLHWCAKCVCGDLGTGYAPRGSSLVQCAKCPLALHKPHCLVAGCLVLSASQMICYLHLHIESELNLYKHLNMDTCLECGESGSLYCCDFCSSAYHHECMERHHLPVEEGEGRWGGGEAVGSSAQKWICPACRDHDLPTYESVVLCKFGVWRWWPGQVIPMEDVPDNIMKKQPGEGMFVVRFCGTNDYCWIHHGRTLSISLEPGAEPAKEVSKMCRSHGKKSAYTDKVFRRACQEAMDLYMEQVRLQEKSKPLPKQESKAYTKIKINKYLVPRPTISDDDLHSLPCQCTPESPCDDDSICVNRAIHVECDPKTCPVGLFCHNQKMRRFQYANTAPFYTGNRGWGLQAAGDIHEGDFVVEYVGEVLDMEMCRERLRMAHETQTPHFYMLTLDSRNGLVIDAKEKSNHARFINHSCDPNCETQKWTVGHESRVGIFAKRDIKSGAELTFDYQLDSLGNEKKECLCGSRNCSGFIGVRSKVEPKPKPKPKVKKKPKPPAPQKPRLHPPDAPSVEETHENECFLCGDGGDLLCCDFGKCQKVYHLHCIGRKLIPPEQWVCPRHYCSVCSKRSFVFCGSCPISFCGKHRRDRLVEVDGQWRCESCCNGGTEVPKESEASKTVSIPLSAASVASKAAAPAVQPAVVPSTPPPPPPPPLPPLPTLPPVAMPSVSPLPSLSQMHHTLSSVPVLTHPLAHHPLHTFTPHQSLQLIMPPSNHVFYFNSAHPFIASPSSPLIYPSTYHH